MHAPARLQACLSSCVCLAHTLCCLLRIIEYSLYILLFISYLLYTLSSFLLHFILFLFCSILLYIYIYIYIYISVSILCNTHSFHKEKYSFLLSFHMVSESWKIRVRSHPRSSCRSQICSSPQAKFLGDFLTTSTPASDHSSKIARACSPCRWKNLRQQTPHAPAHALPLLCEGALPTFR